MPDPTNKQPVPDRFKDISFDENPKPKKDIKPSVKPKATVAAPVDRFSDISFDEPVKKKDGQDTSTNTGAPSNAGTTNAVPSSSPLESSSEPAPAGGGFKSRSDEQVFSRKQNGRSNKFSFDPNGALDNALNPKKPTVSISGVPVPLDVPVPSDPQGYAKQLQDRLVNKTFDDNDVDVVSKSMKDPSGNPISKSAAIAYMDGKVSTGTLIHFNDIKAKNQVALSNSVNQANKDLGLTDSFEDVYKTPESASAYLKKIQALYEDKSKAGVEALPVEDDAFAGGVMNPVAINDIGRNRADVGAIESENKNAAQKIKAIVTNDIADKIAARPDLTKEQKVKELYRLVDPKHMEKMALDKDERLSPVRALVDYVTISDTKDAFEMLNSRKGALEYQLNNKIKQRIDYNNALIGSVAESGDQATMTDEEKATITNAKTENDRLKKEYSTEKELFDKYPSLFKMQIVSKLNDFNAIKSDNVEGEKGYEGMDENDFLKMEGYDLENQVTADAVNWAKDHTKDYSYFGNPKKEAIDVFLNAGKSIGDILQLRDEATRDAEDISAELFPNRVGENDQYQLKGGFFGAKNMQNISNTTGQVIGQAAFQYGTAGLGRMAGLSKLAAMETAFYISGALPSYDQAYKDSGDFIENKSGRVLYAALIALSNAVSEKMFPDVKIFQIPGVKDQLAALASKAGTKEFTSELTDQALGKVKNAIVQYSKHFSKNVAEETAEEVSTQWFEDASRFIAGDPNASIEKAIENTKNTAYQTATGMLAIGLYGAHKDVRGEKNVAAKATLYNAALYPDEAMDAINEGFRQKLYDQAERDEKIKTVNTAIAAKAITEKTEKIYGKSLKRPERELYVANLTAEALLKDQIKDAGEDEDVKKGLEEKIFNLRQQRQQILKGEARIDDFGDVVDGKPVYKFNGKEIGKGEFLIRMNSKNVDDYDLEVTNDDAVQKALRNIGGKDISSLNTNKNGKVNSENGKSGTKAKGGEEVSQANQNAGDASGSSNEQGAEKVTATGAAGDNTAAPLPKQKPARYGPNDITPAEQTAIEGFKGKKFEGSVKGWTDVIQSETSTPAEKKLALKELGEQLSDPNSEIAMGMALGTAAEGVYDLISSPKTDKFDANKLENINDEYSVLNKKPSVKENIDRENVGFVSAKKDYKKANEISDKIKLLRSADGSISEENMPEYKRLRKEYDALEQENNIDRNKRVERQPAKWAIDSFRDSNHTIGGLDEVYALKKSLKKDGYTDAEIDYIIGDIVGNKSDLGGKSVAKRFDEINKNKQSLSKQESGGKAPVTKPEGKSDVVVDKASNVGGDVDFTAKSGNKVVDENGEPLELYHGTSKAFDNLDDSKTKRGLFFTSNKKTASSYANTGGDAPKIISAHIDMKNPHIIDAKGKSYDEIMVDLDKVDMATGKGVSKKMTTDEIVEALRGMRAEKIITNLYGTKTKADGIIIKNVKDALTNNLGNPTDIYIPFKNEQIKRLNQPVEQSLSKQESGASNVGGDVEQTLLDNYSNKGRDESSKKVVQEDGTVLDRLDGVVYSVTEPTKGADGKVDKNLRQIIPTNDKSLDGQPLWKDMSNTSEVPDIRVVTKENAPPKPKPSDFSGLPEKERYKAYSEAVEKWENDYTEKKQVGTKKQTTQIQSPLFDYDPEYKGQTKEEIGYKKIKSKAVDQSLKETTKAETTTTNTGVEEGSGGVGGDVEMTYEEKKTDIEKRRQEELSKFQGRENWGKREEINQEHDAELDKLRDNTPEGIEEKRQEHLKKSKQDHPDNWGQTTDNGDGTTSVNYTGKKFNDGMSVEATFVDMGGVGDMVDGKYVPVENPYEMIIGTDKPAIMGEDGVLKKGAVVRVGKFKDKAAADEWLKNEKEKRIESQPKRESKINAKYDAELKAVEQSLKEQPKAGSVGVGGAKIKLDPDLANIDPIIIAARNGDKKAQEKLEEYGLDWEQTTTYRFVGQSEVDVLLANNKVESKRGMADAGIDVTTSSKVTSAANNEYRVTFKESFDLNNGLGKVKLKSKEEGDHHLEKGRGYDINDVAKIERIDENGNVIEVVYEQSLKEQPKTENKPIQNEPIKEALSTTVSSGVKREDAENKVMTAGLSGNRTIADLIKETGKEYDFIDLGDGLVAFKMKDQSGSVQTYNVADLNNLTKDGFAPSYSIHKNYKGEFGEANKANVRDIAKANGQDESVISSRLSDARKRLIESENKPIQNEPIKEALSTTVSSGEEGSVGVGGDVKQQELDAQKINKEAGVDVYVARQGVETNGEKYTLSQINENGNTNTFLIEDANGNEVGKAQLSADGNYLENIRIDEKHRRKGLASKVYDFIELRKGIELQPSPNKQSKEAKALWDNRNLKKSVSNKANGGLLAKSLGEAMSKTFADFKNKQQVLLELENKYFEQKGLSKEDFNKLSETEKAEIIKDAVKWKNDNPELVKAVEQTISKQENKPIQNEPAKEGTTVSSGVKEYPLEDKDKWTSLVEEKDKDKLTYITPDEFLSKAKELEMTESDRKNIDKLKQHILEGKKLDPLEIYSNERNVLGSNIDGRHRAVAAKELGIKEVPVIDYTENKPIQKDPGAAAPLDEKLKKARESVAQQPAAEEKPVTEKIGKPSRQKVAPVEKIVPVVNNIEDEIDKAGKAKNNPEQQDKYKVLANGPYQKAISDGKMTATDAKNILESAEVEVPKDILELANKEQQPETKPSKPVKGDKVFDSKKNVEATVTRVFAPAKNSPQESQPFLMDLKYPDGRKAINQPIGERFSLVQSENKKQNEQSATEQAGNSESGSGTYAINDTGDESGLVSSPAAESIVTGIESKAESTDENQLTEVVKQATDIIEHNATEIPKRKEVVNKVIKKVAQIVGLKRANMKEQKEDFLNQLSEVEKIMFDAHNIPESEQENIKKMAIDGVIGPPFYLTDTKEALAEKGFESDGENVVILVKDNGTFRFKANDVITVKDMVSKRFPSTEKIANVLKLPPFRRAAKSQNYNVAISRGSLERSQQFVDTAQSNLNEATRVFEQAKKDGDESTAKSASNLIGIFKDDLSYQNEVLKIAEGIDFEVENNPELKKIAEGLDGYVSGRELLDALNEFSLPFTKENAEKVIFLKDIQKDYSTIDNAKVEIQKETDKIIAGRKEKYGYQNKDGIRKPKNKSEEAELNRWANQINANDQTLKYIKANEKELKGIANPSILFSSKQDASDFQTDNKTPATLQKLKAAYPDATVVQSQSELPEIVQRKAAEQGVNEVEGVLHNGQVYLVADNISTMGRADGVYRHETIGHSGVIGVLKDKLNPFMESLVNNANDLQKKQIDKLSQRIFNRNSSELSQAEKIVLGEEYVAQAAENISKYPTTWQKVSAFVRSALRDLGFKISVSDNDIKVLLARASSARGFANGTRFSGNYLQDLLNKVRDDISMQEPVTIAPDLKKYGDEMIDWVKQDNSGATYNDVIAELNSEVGNQFTEAEKEPLYRYIRQKMAGKYVEPSAQQSQPAAPQEPTGGDNGNDGNTGRRRSQVPMEGAGMTHADTAETRQEFNLPDYEKQAGTFQEWDEQARQRIADGKMQDVLDNLKMGFGLRDEVEQRMMGMYLAHLSDIAGESGSNEDIRNLYEAIKLSDRVGGSLAAKILTARKGLFDNDASLAGYWAREMEATHVDELTDEQIELNKQEFEDRQQADKDYEKELAKLKKQVAKWKAKAKLKEEKEKAERKASEKKKQSEPKTHEQLIIEKEKLTTSIKDKLRQARERKANPGIKKQNAAAPGFTPAPAPNTNPKLDKAEALALVDDDMQDYIRTLVDDDNSIGLDEVQQSLFDILEEDVDGLTMDDVTNVIAGDYTKAKRPLTDLQKMVREIKEEAKLVKKLKDLLDGKIPDKPEKKKELNKNIAALRKQIADIRKNIPDNEKRLQNYIDRIKKQADKVEEKLSNNDLSTDQRSPFLDDPALKAEFPELFDEAVSEKERLTKMNKKMQELRKELPYDEKDLQRYIDRQNKEAERIQAKIDAGDYSTDKKKPSMMEDADVRTNFPEQYKKALEAKDRVIKIKIDREVRLMKEELKNRKWWQKKKDDALELLNMPRTLMSSVDFSAPLRQGIIPTITHPSMAFGIKVVNDKLVYHGAFWQMFKYAFNKKDFDRWFHDLKESPNFQLMQKAGLYVADPHNHKLMAKEEMFMNNAAEKLPFLGRLVSGSERAYVGYLNKMRVDLFMQGVDLLESRQKYIETDLEDYQALAKWVGNSTGRGNMTDMMEKASPLLNATFFSPRLISSRLNLLNPVNYVQVFRTSPEVGKMMLGDMAKFVTFGLSVLAMASLNSDCENGEDKSGNPCGVEVDPRSTDFGKIRSINTRYDIWGGFQQYVRVIAQLYSGKAKSTSTGEIINISGEEDPEYRSYFGTDRSTVIGKFVRGKFAPIPSLITDLVQRRTGMGDKINMRVHAPIPGTTWGGELPDKPGEMDLTDRTMQMIAPLVAQDLYKAWQDNGVKSLYTTLLPATFGLSVQTYDKKK